MKNKKGIMVESLVRMIIAIIIFLAAISLGKSFFRVSSQAEQSFNQLVKLIERVNAEGGAESMNLVMDQKTALIGFTKEADYVKDSKFRRIGSKQVSDYEQYFWKPAKCERDKACVCLCQSGFKKISDNPHNVPNEYGCKKVICKPIDSTNFLEKINSEDFGLYYGNPLDLNVNNLEGLYKLEGGFIFVRTTDTDITFPGWSTRNNQIYVEKYKDIISVCFKYPCISEEMKNERTGITIGEWEEGGFFFTAKWMIGVDNFPEDGYLDTFYYIENINKDFLGNYYYQYKFGTRPKSAPEQAGFLETSQEKTKQEFESRFINYAKQGKLVEIDQNDIRLNINNFKPEKKINEEGNIVQIKKVNSK